ncbi:hypothetical protein ACSBR1_012818 [Camellia fascicularis]
MGMHRWRVDSPAKIEVFRREFNIPTDVNIRLVGKNDLIMLGGNYMPFPVVSILEGGVRFPLNILFREMLNFYKLNSMQLAINTFRVINNIAKLNRRHRAQLNLQDVQYCYTMCTFQSKNGITYYLKPRSTTFKMIADLPNSNKDARDDYLIIQATGSLLQPDKNFHKYYIPRADQQRLLGLPINICKAFFFLSYIATCKSPLLDILSKSRSHSFISTPAASPREDQGSSLYPADLSSTSVPSQQILPSKHRCRRRPPNSPVARTRSKKR